MTSTKKQSANKKLGTRLFANKKFRDAIEPLPVMAIIVAIGVIQLALTIASAPEGSTVLESEDSFRSGSVSLLSDSEASGNSFIEFGTTPPANSTSQITQHGITFNFDNDYTYGQFANGDYWVLGPVTINSISPDIEVVNTGNNQTSGTFNGWMVNPSPCTDYPNCGFSFDSRMPVYRSEQQRSLPYTAQPNESIVKSVSAANCSEWTTIRRVCVDKMAVLTVLDEIPQDSGATVFRPPYSGTEKPLYSTNDLRTDLLPSLAPPSGYSVPTISSLVSAWQPVQFEAGYCNCGGASNRSYHPIQHMPNYPGDVASKWATGMTRLMLDDSVAEKMPLLIAVIQAGIDVSWDTTNGLDFNDGSGYQGNRKMPQAFTATMLDSQQLKDNLRANEVYASSGSGQRFLSDRAIYRSSNAGRVLFGEAPPAGSVKTQKDPEEYIDGSVNYTGPGTSYQLCCITQPTKGGALIGLLVPETQPVFGQTQFDEVREYIDRWVDFGAWALPDPDNQWPQNHGINTDGGGRRSGFVDAMWDQYRDSLTPARPPLSSYE